MAQGIHIRYPSPLVAQREEPSYAVATPAADGTFVVFFKTVAPFRPRFRSFVFFVCLSSRTPNNTLKRKNIRKRDCPKTIHRYLNKRFVGAKRLPAEQRYVPTIIAGPDGGPDGRSDGADKPAGVEWREARFLPCIIGRKTQNEPEIVFKFDIGTSHLLFTT